MTSCFIKMWNLFWTTDFYVFEKRLLRGIFGSKRQNSTRMKNMTK